MIKNWKPIANIGGVGTPSSQTAFVWDHGCCGESDTAPHLRHPALQVKTLTLYIDAALKACAENPTDLTMRKGNVFLFADGGQAGLQPRMTKILGDTPEKTGNKTLAKNSRAISIGWELASLQKRKRVLRGLVPQLENVGLVGPSLGSLPTRRRRHFDDSSKTNKGTLLAPVPVPSYDACWGASFEEKKNIYGGFRRVASACARKSTHEFSPNEGGSVPLNVVTLYTSTYAPS